MGYRFEEQNDCYFYSRDRSEKTRSPEDKLVGLLMLIRKGMIPWKSVQLLD